MDNYADIMQHPRYQLRHHRPMPAAGRAAQFSAFAALTGFDEEIGEAARLTDPYQEMAADDLDELNAAFRLLLDRAPEQPLVTVTCFRRDAHKEGGAYVSFTGRFRFFDAAEGMLKFTDGTAVPFAGIRHIRIEQV